MKTFCTDTLVNQYSSIYKRKDKDMRKKNPLQVLLTQYYVARCSSCHLFKSCYKSYTPYIFSA